MGGRIYVRGVGGEVLVAELDDNTEEPLRRLYRYFYGVEGRVYREGEAQRECCDGCGRDEELDAGSEYMRRIYHVMDGAACGLINRSGSTSTWWDRYWK